MTDIYFKDSGTNPIYPPKKVNGTMMAIALRIIELA